MEQRDDDGFESVRRAVLERALELAPFEGWTAMTLKASAAKAGAAPAVLAAAFPKGVADLLALWSELLDRVMADAMAGPELPKKIREKVAFAVRARLDAIRPDKEAARRAAATLALPIYAPLCVRLVWDTADAVWRSLGDASTDFNFYSKRAILSGVWVSTFARWLADDAADETLTDEFLAARIENVMQFEKAKAEFKKTGVDFEKAVEKLSGFRYRA